ncbi:hypothetical protein QBC47DRAFT_19140 [Echria macrotheca]|uniref:Uncharacterized protein n=1 Tax=Echria macrotheca TaxID=438768 RepID=A0AAJ0BMN1_9PEZI|nr:hypothetical protein QBC47DRAFT_19140 [Echria macrotheca]
MSGRIRRPTPAFCEDADEADNIIEGTFRCAASSVASPTKEKPNTGKTRNKRRDSTSPLTDSDSTELARGDHFKKSRDREHSSKNKAIVPTPAMRPPVKHARTTSGIPKKEMEASYYGVSPTHTTTPSSRPRPPPPASNNRPASYYGGNPNRPPLANARFYAQQPAVQTPTSFPPPSWAGQVASPFPPPPSPGPVISQQPQDYFSRPLEDRFSSSRPRSSMGIRNNQNPVQPDYDDDQLYDTTLTRRPSTTRRDSKAKEDRRAMPPPMRRPATTRPTTLAFRPPPSTPVPVRRSSVFDEEDFRGDHLLFQDISPHQPYEYGAPLQRARSRGPTVGATSIYDAGDFRTEVATSRNRRHSYYGNKSASSGSGYEDQLRQATIYQEETGGPGIQLTAETLRKAGRNGSSSRSTRSSGSHDESDYRRSATTRTTRSSNDEDVTIRVKGNATLKVGGAEMKCRDGTEINIASRVMPNIRTVSDWSREDYEERERRPRIERPPTRTRTNSQAGSYARSIPKYDPPISYSPYYSGIPYPTFPQTEEGYF